MIKSWRERTLPSEQYLRKALPQTLGNFDITMSFMMIMFFISNPVGTIGAGAVSVIYWVVGALAFFIPSVIAVAQLGAMFPHAGSTYNWTHKALGGFWSFFSTVLFWAPGILATVGSATIAITYIQGLHSTWLTQPWQQGLALILMLIIAGFISLQPLRTVKYLVNITTPLTYGIVALLGLAALFWLATGHGSATSFTKPQDWAVTAGNLPLFGAVVLAYLGADVPIVMAGETSTRYKVTRPLFWGSLGVLIAYFFVTLALMVVEGPQTASLGNFAVIDIINKVFGPIVGDIASVCILAFFPIFVALMSTIFSRLLMAASVDRRLPIALSKLNKYRVPSNAVIFQTVVSILFAGLLFFFPYIIPITRPENLATEVLALSLATLTLLWAISSAFLFIDLLVLYRHDRNWFHAHRIFPMPVLWFCIIVAPIACVAAMVVSVLYSQLPPTMIDNTQWRIYIIGLTALCLAFSFVGTMFANTEANWQDQKAEANAGQEAH